MTYVLPSVFTLPFTLSFRNFKTKIGTRSRLLHCQFFIPQFSHCGIRSQWRGYFVSDVFLFFLPEIYLETGMDTGCMTAQWKSLMLPFLLPLFITLKQHRFVCSHSAYVGVGFSNIPILDVLLARCCFFFFNKNVPDCRSWYDFFNILMYLTLHRVPLTNKSLAICLNCKHIVQFKYMEKHIPISSWKWLLLIFSFPI